MPAVAGAGACAAAAGSAATAAKCCGRWRRASQRRRIARRDGCSVANPGKSAVDLAFLQAIEQECYVVEIVVERVEELGRPLRERVARSHPAFHQVRELAESHRPGHARAALEGVQRALQRLRRFLVGGLAPPRAKLLAGLRKELRGLLEKDRENLPIDVVVDVGRAFRRRQERAAARATGGVADRWEARDGLDRRAQAGSAAAVGDATAVSVGRSVLGDAGRSDASISAGGGTLETTAGRGGMVSSASATRAATVSLSEDPAPCPDS